jgi:hypothetical protein
MNARSLCNKLIEFQALVFGNDLDFIAVTETWLKPDIKDCKILPGNQYTVYRRDCSDGRHGGGVLLAVKSSILSFRRDEIEPDAEILVCDLLPKDAKKLTICVCYRPPDYDDFIEPFASLLAKVNPDDNSRLYILGDLNFPYINWGTVSDTQDSGSANYFCDLVNNYFLTQVVDAPTRYSGQQNNMRSILDLILCNFPDNVSELRIESDIFESDHLVVNFCIEAKVKHQKKTKHTVYNFHNANFYGMRQSLRFIDWDNVLLDNEDVNESCEKWQQVITSIADQYVAKVRVRDIHHPPWVDREIVHLLHKKNNLRRKAKVRDTANLWSRFHRLRANIKKLIQYKKKVYITNLGQSLKDNPKRFWSYYKVINKSSRIPNVVSHHDISASEPRFKANLFNNYFHSVYNTPVAGESVVPLPTLNYTTHGVLSDIVIERDFVSKALRYLDINKASFGIPSQLLKECSEEITVPVTTLFNKSLSTGVFPNQKPDGNLVPIHKAERKSIVSNYRGISLLDQLSKILEKVFLVHCLTLFHQS